MVTSNRNFKFSRGGVGRWSSGPSLNMAVLKTAVQSLITAVFYMEVVGGFKNRGVVANYRSLRYSEY